MHQQQESVRQHCLKDAETWLRSLSANRNLHHNTPFSINCKIRNSRLTIGIFSTYPYGTYYRVKYNLF